MTLAASVLAIVLATQIGTATPRTDPQLDEAQRKIARFTTWEQHRSFIRQEMRDRGVKLTPLIAAYHRVFNEKPTPLVAAAYGRVFRIRELFALHGLSTDGDYFDNAERIYGYLRSPAARDTPAAIYERWCRLRSGPPRLMGDEALIGTETRRGSDGSIVHGQIFDGTVGQQRRDAEVRQLVALAKRVKPSDPELAYMIAYEMPPGAARYAALSKVVGDNPVFGLAGAVMTMRAAEEIKNAASVEKWRARAKAEFDKETHPQLKQLDRKLYKLPW